MNGTQKEEGEKREQLQETCLRLKKENSEPLAVKCYTTGEDRLKSGGRPRENSRTCPVPQQNKQEGKGKGGGGELTTVLFKSEREAGI